MRNDTIIAVDLAKSVFEIAVSSQPGKVDERHRLSRQKFLDFFMNRPPATVIMEACSSAHYWGRKIEGLGHRAILLPTHQVRPYVLRNKTDRTDTKGMLESYRNEDTGRCRSRRSSNRRSGLYIDSARLGWTSVQRRSIPSAVSSASWVSSSQLDRRAWSPEPGPILKMPTPGFPMPSAPLLAELGEEIRELDRRTRMVEQQLEALAESSPAIEGLRTIPGIGLLTATPLFAFVGDPHRFPSGRHLASYLGLTPREYSSGSRRQLGRISKRGNAYLRSPLIHGARATLWHGKSMKKPDRLRAWALRLEATAGHNKAAVALANKLARIAWAVWKHDRNFESVVPAA
jgi:transposase